MNMSLMTVLSTEDSIGAAKMKYFCSKDVAMCFAGFEPTILCVVDRRLTTEPPGGKARDRSRHLVRAP